MKITSLSENCTLSDLNEHHAISTVVQSELDRRPWNPDSISFLPGLATEMLNFSESEHFFTIAEK